MKSLIFNTKEISFVVGESSDRPKYIQSEITSDDGIVHNDVAVCFVCVELGDNNVDVDVIAKELLVYYNLVKKKILIVPFVHLSSDCETSSEKAKLILNILYNELEKSGVVEGVLGFGYHKALIAKWITMSHKGDVAFRDSKYYLKK